MFKYPSDKSIVFVDIEANDKPKRLLQFGAIKYDVDGKTQEVNWFSNPKCEISRHVKSIVKNNIDKIMNGENNTKIIKRISKFLSKTVFISYGEFDYSFLNSLYKKIFLKKLDCIFIDLQLEWKKVTKSKNVWALKKLATFFDINIDDNSFHDALYDSKILFEIFKKWKSIDEDKLIKMIYKAKVVDEIETKQKQNRNIKTSQILNNIDYINGIAFLNFNIKRIQIDEEGNKKNILTNISLIIVEKNVLKKNWNINFDISENNFIYDEYLKQLSICLKKFVFLIKYKKIVINESKFQQLIKLFNLCSKFINVFPLNKISFCDGFEIFLDKINYLNYRFQPNIELIKIWLIYDYLLHLS